MKAILVIDMPSNCKDCNKLVRKGCLKGDYRKEQRPKVCPLKPIPEKKDYTGFSSQGYSEYEARYCDGYNDCIDEILGVKDERYL